MEDILCIAQKYCFLHCDKCKKCSICMVLQLNICKVKSECTTCEKLSQCIECNEIVEKFIDELLIIFEREFDNTKRRAVFRRIFFRVNKGVFCGTGKYRRYLNIKRIFVIFNRNFEIALSIINYIQNKPHECCNYSGARENEFSEWNSENRNSCYFCTYIKKKYILEEPQLHKYSFEYHSTEQFLENYTTTYNTIDEFIEHSEFNPNLLYCLRNCLQDRELIVPECLHIYNYANDKIIKLIKRLSIKYEPKGILPNDNVQNYNDVTPYSDFI